MTRRGLGSVLSVGSFKLRIGRKVFGEVDPHRGIYQTTAHWYTPGRGALPVLVLGEEEWAAIVSVVSTVEYIAPTTPKVWSASIASHHRIRTPNGTRMAVGPQDYKEVFG